MQQTHFVTLYTFARCLTNVVKCHSFKMTFHSAHVLREAITFGACLPSQFRLIRHAAIHSLRHAPGLRIARSARREQNPYGLTAGRPVVSMPEDEKHLSGDLSDMPHFWWQTASAACTGWRQRSKSDMSRGAVAGRHAQIRRLPLTRSAQNPDSCRSSLIRILLVSPAGMHLQCDNRFTPRRRTRREASAAYIPRGQRSPCPRCAIPDAVRHWPADGIDWLIEVGSRCRDPERSSESRRDLTGRVVWREPWRTSHDAHWGLSVIWIIPCAYYRLRSINSILSILSNLIVPALRCHSSSPGAATAADVQRIEAAYLHSTSFIPLAAQRQTIVSPFGCVRRHAIIISV